MAPGTQLTGSTIIGGIVNRMASPLNMTTSSSVLLSRKSAFGPCSSKAAAINRPLVMAGGHDPLLEWALRESWSGIAAFLDGALDGLERAAAGNCTAAGLHIPDSPSGSWNITAVKNRFSNEPWALIEWAYRTRGLIINPSVETSVRGLEDVRGLRFRARQPEAGSELILADLLRQAGMLRSDLSLAATVERSESELAAASLRVGRMSGLALRPVPVSSNLGLSRSFAKDSIYLFGAKPISTPRFRNLCDFAPRPVSLIVPRHLVVMMSMDLELSTSMRAETSNGSCSLEVVPQASTRSNVPRPISRQRQERRRL
jgi:molybdate-binding protein